MQLTKNQIFVHGSDLRRVLKSESFIVAVNHLREDYKARFFSSGYGDTAARESAYRQNVALDDLLASMNAFVMATEVETFQEADEDNN